MGLVALRHYFSEEARNYREAFLKLAEKGIISFKLAESIAMGNCPDIVNPLSNLYLHFPFICP